jgi:hypothetical protein
MANYDWRDYSDRDWAFRFPEGVRGATEWRQQRSETRVDLKALSTRLVEARQEAPPRISVPSLFVSHRQADAAQATRLAYLACQEGFDYWLDVLDPSLQGSGVQGTTATEQAAAATAAVIEMALLNSSHVVAIITQNTRGSQWVPYEYGRVKDPSATSVQAACWLDQSSRNSGLPEYLYLGAILKSEAEIRQWLKTEFQKWRQAPRTCGWSGGIPSPLP